MSQTGFWAGLRAARRRGPEALAEAAEAAEAAAKLVRDARVGVRVVDGRQTLGEWLARWLEIRGQTVDQRSAESYERAARLHITPVLGSVRLCDLAPYHPDRVFARMRAKGLRIYSAVYHVLHASLRDAMRQGYVARNVADLMTAPANVDGVHEPYTPEQALRYLTYALDPEIARPAPRGSPSVTRVERYNRPVRLGPMLALTMLTGLRIGEVAGLAWRDVDLTAQKPTRPSLKVVYQCYWKHGDPIFKRPKTPGSRRAVLLMPRAVEALMRWRARQREERLRAGSAWVTSLTGLSAGRLGQTISFEGLVFTDPIGRPLSHHHIRSQHWRTCKLAGLPIIRPHDLRHSFATLMLSAGVNPKVVAEMLGHSSVNMTLNRYSHVLPVKQMTAIDELSHFLATLAAQEARETGESDDQSSQAQA